ncbi:MAG: hypothetical protein JSR95_05285, partial [Proteobacteria bacterium]|nr:hypothetical protein [Pseudomonadota bacterium]
MKPNFKCAWLLALILAGGNWNLAAAADAALAGGEAQAGDSTGVAALQEITVTSEKRAVNAQKTPQAVTVVTGEDLL